MRLKQKVIGLLVAVCLLAPVSSVTGFAAEEVKRPDTANKDGAVGPDAPIENLDVERVFSYSVIHNGEVLDTAELTLFLEGEDGSRKVLDSSATGTIMFSRNNEELKAYKWLLVVIKLPEGYEFLSYGNAGTEAPTIVSGMNQELTISFYTENILEERYDYGNGICLVTNPSIDGVLELPVARMEANIGDVIDFDGAFDLNAARFPLYHTAPDGTRTRVVCDDFRYSGNSSFYRVDGHRLTITDYGWDTLYFYHGTLRAALEIHVQKPPELAGQEAVVEGDIPDAPYVADMGEPAAVPEETAVSPKTGETAPRDVWGILLSAITGLTVLVRSRGGCPKNDVSEKKRCEKSSLVIK